MPEMVIDGKVDDCMQINIINHMERESNFDTKESDNDITAMIFSVNMEEAATVMVWCGRRGQ